MARRRYFDSEYPTMVEAKQAGQKAVGLTRNQKLGSMVKRYEVKKVGANVKDVLLERLKMVQRTFYMVSSIIMDGAIDKKTLTDARVVAKREALKLFKYKKKWPRDLWVTIDKYNTVSNKNILLESWRWTGTKFVKEV